MSVSLIVGFKLDFGSCLDLRHFLQIQSQIITYLQNKYDDPELKELLYTAPFLDPRFKTEYIYIANDNIPAIK